jgi:hypothetical protein
MPVDDEDDVNATIPPSTPGALLVYVTGTATLTRLIQDNKKAGARDRVEAEI